MTANYKHKKMFSHVSGVKTITVVGETSEKWATGSNEP